MTANTTPAVTGAYAQAAHQLELVPSSENSASAAEQFLNWLRITDRSWLMVLDDVHSPGALEGLWPPRRTAGRGRVIVTTRSRESDLATASGHPLLSVGVFTREESLTHLRNTLQRTVSVGADAELAGLADDLGHLPLALSRAAAYLDYNASYSIARYRRLLADRRLTLERPIPAVRGSAATSSLAALWDIFVEQADQHTGMLARPMLELAAVLDGTTGIPTPLFTSDAARDWLTERSRRSQSRTAACSPGLLATGCPTPTASSAPWPTPLAVTAVAVSRRVAHPCPEGNVVVVRLTRFGVMLKRFVDLDALEGVNGDAASVSPPLVVVGVIGRRPHRVLSPRGLRRTRHAEPQEGEPACI